MPLFLASIVTGGILIYYLGFWIGVFMNATAWGAAVLLAKYYSLRNGRNIDAFRDDRYLRYFILALIGRNK